VIVSVDNAEIDVAGLAGLDDPDQRMLVASSEGIAKSLCSRLPWS